MAVAHDAGVNALTQVNASVEAILRPPCLFAGEADEEGCANATTLCPGEGCAKPHPALDRTCREHVSVLCCHAVQGDSPVSRRR
jgi:hypothetical protein